MRKRGKIKQRGARAKVLDLLIAHHNLARGAEIGVGTGELTKMLLTKHPGLTMLAVDFWPANWDGVTPCGDKVARGRRAAFMTIYAVLKERITLIEKPSVEAALEVPDGSLDFVFIDANHTYACVKADIAAWSPKVRKGGLITGHDYFPKFPGVIRAVDEAFGDRVTAIEPETAHVWAVET